MTVWVLRRTPAASFTYPIIGLTRKHGNARTYGIDKFQRHVRVIPSIFTDSPDNDSGAVLIPVAT